MMAAPAIPGGTLRTTIGSMVIGDYIKCRYGASAGVVGDFLQLGTTTAAELPTTPSTGVVDGMFYFIKADTGLLIADRMVQYGHSWDVLNAAYCVYGKAVTLGGFPGLIRLPKSGIVQVNGAIENLVNDSWPEHNEWDRLIAMNSLGGKITPGDDNVWHWNVSNWNAVAEGAVQGDPSRRPHRGNTSGIKQFWYASTGNVSYFGFRPVFEYKEDGSSIWG